MIYNSNVTEEKDLLDPSEFDPYSVSVKQEKTIPIVGVEFLKDLYIKKDKKK